MRPKLAIAALFFTCIAVAVACGCAGNGGTGGTAGTAATGGSKAVEPTPRRTFLLACDSLRASVEFTDSVATLTIEGESFTLRRARSGSGARYEEPNDTRTWVWNKGDTTTVSVRGRVLEPCTAAPVGAEPFRAHGNEPFWSLEIAGQVATWRTPDGGAVAGKMSLPQSIDDGRGYRYTGTIGGVNVVVTTSNRVCHDGMSDLPYPNFVTVEFPVQTYRGCGGDPVALLQGAEWHVLDIDGDGVIEDSRVTMSFGPENRLGGIGSCNTFSATYTLTGEGGLTFGDPLATLKACSEPLMKQETNFFTVLRAVKRFDVDSTGVLLLATDDGRRIRATR
jgi:heat shock protein HslJ/uncharacterized membrane protein